MLATDALASETRTLRQTEAGIELRKTGTQENERLRFNSLSESICPLHRKSFSCLHGFFRDFGSPCHPRIHSGFPGELPSFRVALRTTKNPRGTSATRGFNARV